MESIVIIMEIVTVIMVIMLIITVIKVIMVIIRIIITLIMVGKVRGEEVSKTWKEGGSRKIIIINSTQKVSSGVMNSQNMMSVARTSYFILLQLTLFQIHVLL